MRLFVAFFLILVPLLSFGQLAWEKSTLDFGTIREDDGIATRVFRFKNAGWKDVTIHRAVSSCGCTTLKNAKRVVKSRVSDSLVVAYNPVGRPGAFNKYVKVITGDSVYNLHIIGSVIPSKVTVKNRFPAAKGNVALSSGVIAFEEVPLLQRKSVRFFGCNLSNKTLPLSIEGLPRNSSYSFYPDTVSPGNVFSAAVTFVADTADFGMHRFSPLIIAGDSREPLEMSATVVAPPYYDVSELTECKMADDRIAFVDYGKRKLTKADLTVENTGKADLEIRGIATDSESVSAVSAFPMVVKPGEKAHLKFVLDGTKENKTILNNILVIYTNDPMKPNRQVRIVGTK